MPKVTPIRSSDVEEDATDLEEQVTNETADNASPDLVPILGANLRRLRVKRGLSLDRLAKLSGVSSGAVTISVGSDVVELAAGDAVLFSADVPHTYANRRDQPALLYLVMTYAHEVGG